MECGSNAHAIRSGTGPATNAFSCPAISTVKFKDRLAVPLFLKSLYAAADLLQHSGESGEALGNPFDVLIYYPASRGN